MFESRRAHRKPSVFGRYECRLAEGFAEALDLLRSLAASESAVGIQRSSFPIAPTAVDRMLARLSAEEADDLLAAATIEHGLNEQARWS